MTLMYTQSRLGISPKFQFWLFMLFSFAYCYLLSYESHASEISDKDTKLQSSKSYNIINRESVFFPKELVIKARKNFVATELMRQEKQRIIEKADYWVKLSDDELWDIMFGNTIIRSWMVWSDGICPSCKKPVRMYEWKVNAKTHPWKMQCPCCSEYFPKNDFHAYYKSGLDEHGIFNAEKADNKLLFNTEHPDPKDPLHMFGVDDGNGYVEDRKRWRFIGAYLIYGQWKQLVVDGIVSLADAYLLTGKSNYAHKAGVLLDRVADIYPTFSFNKQARIYESTTANDGYISVWHDACNEVVKLTIAYDKVKKAIATDETLASFLNKKAIKYAPPLPKINPKDIIINIEERIFRDTLKNQHKIGSNYPDQDQALMMILAVLDWEKNKEQIMLLMKKILDKGTAVDGLVGEKGIFGYSAIGPMRIASIIGLFSRADSNFLDTCFRLCPKLKKTWRFHINAWCLQKYYPGIGDAGAYGKATPTYIGVPQDKAISFEPSSFTFLWNLYQYTGDVAYVQALYANNGYSLSGLPYDITCDDPEKFQRDVKAVIDQHGHIISLASVDNPEFHLAILRSGILDDARDVWIGYDCGGPHSHIDGMTFGIHAKGLDLMPDLGYPPVNYGGWWGDNFSWCNGTVSHNTVVVDKKNLNLIQNKQVGAKSLWIDEKGLKAFRANSPAMLPCAISEGNRYERTLLMIDYSEKDSYIVDVFRVSGGKEHAKFQHSLFGKLVTTGIQLKDTDDPGFKTKMKNFKTDLEKTNMWMADWAVEDKMNSNIQLKDIHLRMHSLTKNVQVYTCEGWNYTNFMYKNEESWFPRTIEIRKSDDAPLVSTFVSVLEPYENKPFIASVKRYEQPNDSDVAIEITFTDGTKQLVIIPDVLLNNEIMISDWNVNYKGDVKIFP